MKANGLVVFVPKYGIEGPVYLVPKDAANNVNQQVGLPVCVCVYPDNRGFQSECDGAVDSDPAVTVIDH